MYKINKINQAFTLIELLVVIVIVGVLATVTTSTFNGSLEKGRDAGRTSFVRQFSDILIGEAIATQEGQPDKYNFSTAEMTTLLDENNLEVPTSNNICPQVIVTLGPESNPLNGNPEDNNLCVLSWGEASSTDNGNTAGLIYSGTSLCQEVYEGDTSFDVDDFQCEAPVAYLPKPKFEFFPTALAQFQLIQRQQGYYVTTYPKSSASLRQHYVDNGQTNVGFAIHGGGYVYPVYVYKIKPDKSLETVGATYSFVCTANCPS